MGTGKPMLAQWFVRFPNVRVAATGLLSLLLHLGLLPLLAKLFRVKRVDQTQHGRTEQQVLDMVKQTVPKGNPQAVLNAIDRYVQTSNVILMNIGDVKGKIVEQVIAQYQPKVAMELGTYIGYSAIATASKLPAGGKLYGIDPDAVHVKIARQMIEHAGLSQQVEIIEGVLETVIPGLRKRGVTTIDYTLIDHDGALYMKDLLILQQSGLLQKGSVIAADNILIPGAPEYRKYMACSADFATVEHITDVPFSHYFCDIFTVSEYLNVAVPS